MGVPGEGGWQCPGAIPTPLEACGLATGRSEGVASEPRPPGSERVLKPVVLKGDVVPGSLPPLSEIWEFAQSNLRRLPDGYRQLVTPSPYPVRLSEGICRMRDRAIAEQRGLDLPAGVAE